MNFRNRLTQFMYGRYGADQLSRLYSGIALGCFVVYLFVHVPVIYLAGLILLIYSMYRTFSKNITKMSAQNQKYLNWRYQLAVKRDRLKKRFAQRKDYRFYKCPDCRQRVRVPRGHGRIAITCPKCRTEFVRKS